MKRLLITAFAVLLFPLLTKAQFIISGTVSEKDHHLPGASIRIKDGGAGTKTDRNGYYQLKNLQAGEYTLEVSYMGYQTQEKKHPFKRKSPARFQPCHFSLSC